MSFVTFLLKQYCVFKLESIHLFVFNRDANCSELLSPDEDDICSSFKNYVTPNFELTNVRASPLLSRLFSNIMCGCSAKLEDLELRALVALCWISTDLVCSEFFASSFFEKSCFNFSYEEFKTTWWNSDITKLILASITAIRLRIYAIYFLLFLCESLPIKIVYCLGTNFSALESLYIKGWL